MTLSSQKIEYSNCRSLPIKCYQFINRNGIDIGKEWPHKGGNEILFGEYINCTNKEMNCKLKVTFKDGTFVYVTKK